MIHGPAYVAFLLKYAIVISGYSMPYDVPLPTLVEFSHVQMVHNTCPKHKHCKTVYGYYRDDEIIYVDPSQIQKEQFVTEDSVVVHELTHWLQQHHGHGGFSCEQVGFREREAYRVQQVFVEQYEHGRFPLRAPDWNC